MLDYSMMDLSRYGYRKDYVYGFSGYFPNMTHQRVIEDIEIGFRATTAQEDEDLGFGPLFDLYVKELESD